MGNSLPLKLLKKYWGYPSFRPPQEEIINASLQGKDVFAILPTGGGKSICYQIAGLARKKLTIVISPLIALMKDQVEQLTRRNIRATYINSSLSKKEIEKRLYEAQQGYYDFLYCAPERLDTDKLLDALPYLDIGLLAIDEAHCISQWGHQFRPAYRKIAEFRRKIPDVPVMAVTASATPEVRKDIMEQLEMKEPAIFVKTFVRPNLRYSVLYEEDPEKKMFEILRNVPGTSIIYVRSRKATEEYAALLRKKGISAKAYHAGLSNAIRNKIQEEWIKNKVRVIVATNAFGMGIDKPDVRTVIHLDLPPDLESYYQEAGRAGRDGKTAYPVILYHPSFGDKLIKQWEYQYPDFETVKTFYEILCSLYYVTKDDYPKATFVIDLPRWRKHLKKPYMVLMNSLRILEDAELIEILDERDKYKANARILVSPKKLRKVIQKNENYEKVIETLIRESNGKIFDSYYEFDIRAMAWKNNMGENMLDDVLTQLVNHRVLDYIKPLGESGFRFISPRRKITKRLLNWELQEFLKEQSRKRLYAMIDYAETIDKCRTQMIANYFGETGVEPCGKCDVCVGRHKVKHKISSYDVKQIVLRFIERRGKIHKSEVYKILPSRYKDSITLVLQQLIDSKEVRLIDYEYLEMK